MNAPRTERNLKSLRHISERKRKILIAIERYGSLDSKHLSLISGLNQKNMAEPARELFDAGLVDRPPNNLYRRDRFKDAQVYKSTALGLDWLERNDLVPPRAMWRGAGGQPHHDLTACHVLASIEAAHREAGLEFYTWEQILDKAPEATRNLKNPYRFTTDHGDLVPDAIFTTGYGNDQFRISFLEVDLSDHGEKAYRLKAQQYNQLIFKGIYKKRLGVSQHARVLTVTSNSTRRNIMVEHTQKQDPSLFKVAPQYGSFEIPAPPALTILEDWHWPAKPNAPVTLATI